MRLSSRARWCLRAGLLITSLGCNVDGTSRDDIVVSAVQVCGAAEPAQHLSPLTMDARHKKFFAPHPLATIVDQGGPKLTSPRVVAVFFGDDPLQKLTEDFLQSYGCTSYWRDTVSEYGIGDVQYLRSVVIPQYPVIKDNMQTSGLAFAEWVKKELKAGTFGKLAAQDLPLFFAPRGAEHAGPNMGGYHSEVPERGPSADPLQNPYPSETRPFAVIYADTENSGRYAFDDRTAAASHELIEASTDPYPGSKPALVSVTEGSLAPSLAPNAAEEIADFCLQYDTSTDYPFAVSYAYSNRRARAGLDPCFPDKPIKAMVAAHGSGATVHLLHPERPLELDLFADDADAQFEVMVSDLIVQQQNGVPAWISLRKTSQPIKSGARAQFDLGITTLPSWILPDQVASDGHALHVSVCPAGAPDSSDCVYQSLPVDQLPPLNPAVL